VRFEYDFPVHQMPPLFDHFCDIMEGKPTYKWDPKKTNTEDQETETDAFKNYLRMVDQDKADELDVSLIKKIQDAIQANADDYESKLLSLQHFDLCHKYSQQFSYGFNFVLRLGRLLVQELDSVPTLEKLLQVIRTNAKCGDIRAQLETNVISNIKTKFPR